MTFSSEFALTASASNPGTLEGFRKRVPEAWIEQALAATGTATIRRRRLPAEQVLWLVLGMAMYRDSSIEAIVDRLDLALPGASTVARSSIPQARARLGSNPVRWLARETGKAWGIPSARAEEWRGLGVFGIDGTSLRIPDTKANRETFGGQTNHLGDSGYPIMRVVALMALRSHIVIDAIVGGFNKINEQESAVELLPSIPENSLVVVDKNFFGAPLLHALERSGNRHWLRRARANSKWKVVSNLGPDDDLVTVEIAWKTRVLDEELPRVWTMRAISYEIAGKKHTVLTSLKDPVLFPAKEVIALYRERWEIELGYDELKTELLDREETLRSRTPVGVQQEIWGCLLVYNLIRVEMTHIAREARVPPIRISFIASLQAVREEWSTLAIVVTRSPGTIPKRLSKLRARLKLFVLPPRRTQRSFPRAVKRTSGYPKKKKTVPAN